MNHTGIHTTTRWVAVAALAVLAACGSSRKSVTFDSASSTTSTDAPSATVGPPSTATEVTGTTAAPLHSTVPPPTAGWVDVTGSLTGLPSGCGTVTVVAGSPSAPAIVAGVTNQGVWGFGEDGDWSRMGSGAGSATIDNRPFSITFDPSDGQTFWETGGYGGTGVFRTSDGGVTFRRLGSVEHIQTLGVDFSDSQRSTLVAAVHETAGLYQSRDGGETWNDLTSSLPESIGYIAGVVVTGPLTYVIGTTTMVGGSTTGDGLYRTTDGGQTWTSGFLAPVDGSPLVSTKDGSIYWTLAQGRGLIRSDDGGVSWIRVNESGLVSSSASPLAEMSDGTLVAAGRATLITSGDRGVSWQPLGPTLPFTPTSVTFSGPSHAAFVASWACDVTKSSQPVEPGTVMRLNVPAG